MDQTPVNLRLHKRKTHTALGGMTGKRKHTGDAADPCESQRTVLSAQIQRMWLDLRQHTDNPETIINHAVLQLADLSALRNLVALISPRPA